MQTSALDRTLLLAALLNHSLVRLSPSPYIWDGYRSYVGAAPEGSPHQRGPMGPFEICHELAHRLCATPEERTQPEWGLGREPTYGAAADRGLAGTVPREYRELVEDAVCSVQGLLLLLVGHERSECRDAEGYPSGHQRRAFEAACRRAAGRASRVDLYVLARIDRALAELSDRFAAWEEGGVPVREVLLTEYVRPLP